jgi:hypothetical protein
LTVGGWRENRRVQKESAPTALAIIDALCIASELLDDLAYCQTCASAERERFTTETQRGAAATKAAVGGGSQ